MPALVAVTGWPMAGWLRQLPASSGNAAGWRRQRGYNKPVSGSHDKRMPSVWLGGWPTSAFAKPAESNANTASSGC